VFPDTVVQTCIVHLIRYAMQFASWKERKAIAKDLRPIYAAPGAEALDAFEEGPWGQKYSPIVASWRRKWEQVIPFFAFSPEVRKMLYTTNATSGCAARRRAGTRRRQTQTTTCRLHRIFWNRTSRRLHRTANG